MTKCCDLGDGENGSWSTYDTDRARLKGATVDVILGISKNVFLFLAFSLRMDDERVCMHVDDTRDKSLPREESFLEVGRRGGPEMPLGMIHEHTAEDCL